MATANPTSRQTGVRGISPFGNTGRIRHYDMVMYDRATESWWQQFLGEAIIGEMTGHRLATIPARIEALTRFRERAPEGKLLVPTKAKARPYGLTPYVKYDSPERQRDFPYKLPPGLAPMARVIVIDGEAWTLDLVRRKRTVEAGDIVLRWEPGQNSIHDERVIAFGRDVGNIIAQRRTADGLKDTVYDVTFAFAFRAFHPNGDVHAD